jgi:hypothetical protein
MLKFKRIRVKKHPRIHTEREFKQIVYKYLNTSVETPAFNPKNNRTMTRARKIRQSLYKGLNSINHSRAMMHRESHKAEQEQITN